MFVFLAGILLLLSVSGLAISLLRLKEFVPGDVSNAKVEAIAETLLSLEWVFRLPHDALLLVAAFLIASGISLRAVIRGSSAKSTGFTRYRLQN